MLRWSFELLNRHDQKIRDLTTVTGGRADILALSPLGGSARVSLDSRPLDGQGEPIDWLSHRIRANFHDGAESWPVGTYRFTSPTEKHNATRVTAFDVGLKTKMSVPMEDTTDGRFTLPEGTNAVAAAADMLLSTGETRVAVTASAKVLDAPMTWEEATPKLEIINTLLKYAGYWSLWCDGSGLYRIEPYVDPADRPPAFRFQHGEASVHYPEWEREQDHSSVPNKFTAVGVRRGDDPVLVGIARNLDPNSPYSIPNRGTIAAREDGVEAESQEVIDQIAARGLIERMGPSGLLKVTHRMMDLDPNALVEFIAEDALLRRATVLRMGMTFDDFTPITAEWREVA